MASMHSLSSSSLLLLMLAVVLFLSPPLSTSRRLTTTHIPPKAPGFRVTLRHVDSGRNLTKFERLQRRIHRGKFRLQRLTSLASSSPASVQAPVQAGSGEFLMQLSVGTPAEPFSAIMDTGSDLIWTQCAPCSHCYNQTGPIFDPKKSSSFAQLACSSRLCTALGPMSSCGDNGCEYFYTYGDYSSTQGAMGMETFTFGAGGGKPSENGGVSVKNVAFGCGLDNEGDGFQQAAGLVGLGRGPLSLVSQLDEPAFSYCLTGIDDAKTSSLLLGSVPAGPKGPNSKSVTTGLIKNSAQPSFYYISLEGISVGGTRLDIDKSTFELQPDGSGGLIIDSGTTLTYLEQSAYDLVRKEFVAQTKLSEDNSGSGGLDLCFTLPSSGSGSTTVEVPKLVFHFAGGADLDLPTENYLIADAAMGLACLAMGRNTGMSILGNVQQQNVLVVHDLKKETLSFLPTDCTQL